MANLRDIYFKVGKDLYTHAFDIESTGRKKKLVDDCLKTYITEKIAEEDYVNAIKLSRRSDVSTDELVTMLGELIPQSEHFDTLRHLTHFILNIAGEMQGWSITWYSEKDPAFIDNPAVEFNEDGKLDCLKTHEQDSYVTTFQKIYGLFQNVFMVKSNDNKKLVMNLNQLPSSNK